MSVGKVVMSIGAFLEVVGEHSDFSGYSAIRQNLFNQAGGGRSGDDFLRLNVEVYLGAFLREVGKPEGQSKLHVRILFDERAPAL